LIVAGPGKYINVDGTYTGSFNKQLMGKAFPYQLADTGKYDVWMMN
jgi:hypothetical protein